MSTDNQRNEELPETAPAASDCPLSTRQQTRNLLIFGINKSLIYLVGCVIYVGNIDAVLLKELGYLGSATLTPPVIVSLEQQRIYVAISALR